MRSPTRSWSSVSTPARRDSFVSIVLLFLSFLTRSLLVSFRSVPLRFPICFVLFCSVPFLAETRRNATFFSWFVFLVWKFVKPSPPPNTKTQNAKPPTQRNATQHIHRRRKARPRLLQVRDGRRWVRHPLRDLPKGLRHRLRGIEGHQRPIADLSRLDPPRHQGLGRPRSRIRPRGNLSRDRRALRVQGHGRQHLPGTKQHEPRGGQKTRRRRTRRRHPLQFQRRPPGGLDRQIHPRGFLRGSLPRGRQARPLSGAQARPEAGRCLCLYRHHGRRRCRRKNPEGFHRPQRHHQDGPAERVLFAPDRCRSERAVLFELQPAPGALLPIDGRSDQQTRGRHDRGGVLRGIPRQVDGIPDQPRRHTARPQGLCLGHLHGASGRRCLLKNYHYCHEAAGMFAPIQTKTKQKNQTQTQNFCHPSIHHQSRSYLFIHAHNPSHSVSPH
mmetsp:Transcript_2848/g.6168  ORF Transcript_2848/g.6168 Transcript_2848/m.6168 type:complete len:442 (-) Transcript_2848:1460-2785(-)